MIILTVIAIDLFTVTKEHASSANFVRMPLYYSARKCNWKHITVIIYLGKSHEISGNRKLYDNLLFI